MESVLAASAGIPSHERRVPAFVSNGLVAVIVFVWLAFVASGANPFTPTPADLFRWGANATSAAQEGQWWRLLTSMFMHSGIVHLSLNAVMLWYVGRYSSRYFDQWTLLCAFLISGLVGNAVSLHISVQTRIAVGASAAILGVIGALLPFVWHKDSTKRGRRQAVALTALAGMSVLLGFIRQGYDQAAHIGGLCAGIAIGFLLTRTTLLLWKKQLIGSVMGLLTVALLAVTAPAAKLNMADYFAAIETWKSLQPEIEQVLTRLDNDIGDFKARKITRFEMLERMETERLPEMQNTASRLGQLHLPKEDPIGRKAITMTQLTSALTELISAEIAYSKNPSLDNEKQIRALASQVIALRKAFVADKLAKNNPTKA